MVLAGSCVAGVPEGLRVVWNGFLEAMEQHESKLDGPRLRATAKGFLYYGPSLVLPVRKVLQEK